MVSHSKVITVTRATTKTICRNVLNKHITLANFDNVKGGGMTAVVETIANYVDVRQIGTREENGNIGNSGSLDIG